MLSAAPTLSHAGLFSLLVPIRPDAAGRNLDWRLLPTERRGAVRARTVRIAAADQEWNQPGHAIDVDVYHPGYRRGRQAAARKHHKAKFRREWRQSITPRSP